MKQIEIKGRIRWADADAAGRLYFPRIFDYFSEGEGELLRRIGFPRTGRAVRYDFPRVHAECEFKKILSLDAPFTLRLRVGRLGRTSIRYEFDVHADDDESTPAARGSVTVVVVENGRPAEIPEALRTALEGDF